MAFTFSICQFWKKLSMRLKRLSSTYDSLKGLVQKGTIWYWIKELYSKTSFKWAAATDGLEFKRKSDLETDKPLHGLQAHLKPPQFLKLDYGDTRLLLNLLAFQKQTWHLKKDNFVSFLTYFPQTILKIRCQ